MPSAAGESPDPIVIGRVGGGHGVCGWLRVQPYTSEPAAMLGYRQWLVDDDGSWREMAVIEGRVQGGWVLARLAGIDDRDGAERLRGARIAVRAGQLPALPEGEYYWHQLEGLTVRTVDGKALGRVRGLIETGANDVLIVAGERERLVPYTEAAVRRVDLENGVIEVDWDADF